MVQECRSSSKSQNVSDKTPDDLQCILSFKQKINEGLRFEVCFNAVVLRSVNFEDTNVQAFKHLA